MTAEQGFLVDAECKWSWGPYIKISKEADLEVIALCTLVIGPTAVASFD
jgi:hypothetical protein